MEIWKVYNYFNRWLMQAISCHHIGSGVPPDWNRVTHLKSCESFFCVPMHNFPSKWHGLSHLCTLDPINNKLFFWGAYLWNITCYYFCHNIYYLETLKVSWLCSGVANLPSMLIAHFKSAAYDVQICEQEETTSNSVLYFHCKHFGGIDYHELQC